MTAKTLSQKTIELVGEDPDSFDEAKEKKLQDLLKPVNHEIPIDAIKWRGRKSTW